MLTIVNVCLPVARYTGGRRAHSSQSGSAGSRGLSAVGERIRRSAVSEYPTFSDHITAQRDISAPFCEGGRRGVAMGSTTSHPPPAKTSPRDYRYVDNCFSLKVSGACGFFQLTAADLC